MRHTRIAVLAALPALVLGATTLFAASAWAADAPDAVDVATYRVGVDERGEIAMSDLATMLALHVEGEPLEVDTTERKVVTGARGAHYVRMWQNQLQICGVTFAVEPSWLVVTVEEAKPRRHRAYYRSIVGRMAKARTSRRATTTTTRAAPAPPAEPGLARSPQAHKGGPPVVLVHGMDSSPRVFAATEAALGKRGYDVYLFHYRSSAPIPESSALLGRELKELRGQLGGTRRVSLVTTSMGGLVAQHYLEQDPTYGGEVARFVALCPPFAGAGLAHYRLSNTVMTLLGSLAAQGMNGVLIFDSLGDSGDDLLPGSALLQKMARGKRRAGVRYSIIAGSGAIVTEEALDMIGGLAAQLGQDAEQAGRDLADWFVGATAEARKVAGGRGDGAVALDSARLSGVSDRVVLPINHLEFLTPRTPEASLADVPALAEVVKRLPRVR